MRPFLALAAFLVVVPAVAQEPQVIADKVAFPEGPYVEDGTLFFTEYAGNKVNLWDGSSLKTVWEGQGCGPSAILPLGEDLVVTCYDNGTIARIGRDGKKIATYDKAADGGALQGPNDFAEDGKGGVYFTASGPWESGPIVGKVFHLRPDGAIRQVADDLHYANGIARGADGRLYVNESEAGRVISFAAADDGSLSDRRLFVRVGVVDEKSGIGAYPDGLKVGPDGNFYIGQYSSGRIVVVNPAGEFQKVIEVPSAAAPNMAFSVDGKVLYVTAVDDTAAAPYPGKVYAVGLD